MAFSDAGQGGYGTSVCSQGWTPWYDRDHKEGNNSCLLMVDKTGVVAFGLNWFGASEHCASLGQDSHLVTAKEVGWGCVVVSSVCMQSFHHDVRVPLAEGIGLHSPVCVRAPAILSLPRPPWI